MKKLIQGIVDFRLTQREAFRDVFKKLALGQSPDALFIGCSDSRVVPNLFASTDPGDLFVVRNVGNLIPPCCPSTKSSNIEAEPAAIEFSLLQLKVDDIVVCGHSECGAMQALLSGTDKNFQHIGPWLKNAQGALEKFKTIDSYLSSLPAKPHNQLSQLNVLQQIQNLYTYPLVKERVAKQQLKIHGWWFDLENLDIYAYEQSHKKFILLDEKEARRILSEDDPSHIIFE
jgi:carbonic anhydrase